MMERSTATRTAPPRQHYRVTGAFVTAAGPPAGASTPAEADPRVPWRVNLADRMSARHDAPAPARHDAPAPARHDAPGNLPPGHPRARPQPERSRPPADALARALAYVPPDATPSPEFTRDLVVPRHRWPAAHARLTAREVPFIASAPDRDVLVTTTAVGVATLDGVAAELLRAVAS